MAKKINPIILIIIVLVFIMFINKRGFLGAIVTQEEVPKLSNIIGATDIWTVSNINNWKGQSFTPTEDFILTKAILKMRRRGSPGGMNANIRKLSDLENNIASTSFNGNNLPTTETNIELDFSNAVPQLSAGTEYVLVIRGGSSPDHNVRIYGLKEDTYSGGSVWTVSGQEADSDWYFELFGIDTIGDTVKFRTTSTSYSAFGNNIAFNLNCNGAQLEQFRSKGTGTFGSSCLDNAGDLIMSGLPGVNHGNCVTGSNLYFSGSLYYVCCDDLNNKGKYTYYDKEISGLQTSFSVEPSRESSCEDIPPSGCETLRTELGDSISGWIQGSVNRDALGVKINEWVNC